MAKVYVVTVETFFLRSIAVFSTKEKAETCETAAHQSNIPRPGISVTIHECNIDELEGATYGPIWVANISLNWPHLVAVDAASGNPIMDELRDLTQAHWTVFENTRFPALSYIRVASPISEEHAFEIAAGKRQEWLRTRNATADGGVVATD